jgi:hypothetical protein
MISFPKYDEPVATLLSWDKSRLNDVNLGWVNRLLSRWMFVTSLVVPEA